MQAEAPLLKVEDLSVTFRTDVGSVSAVRGISFEIKRGETLALVGESGCGKSATSLALMRLLPSSARVSAKTLRFLGVDLQSASSRAYSDLRGDRIAMVFQEPMTTLNPLLTIGEQLAEPMVRHRGSSRREALERAAHLLDRVGIADPSSRLRQYPHEFSGGMRQRVVIAMALICSPDLLLADEPTTALDVTTQAQILDLLGELISEFDMGLLIITHDLGVVARSATRTAVMYAGEIVETGKTESVLAEPLHPYTRGLLASVPGSQAPKSRLGTISGVVPSLLQVPIGCAFQDRCTLAVAACSHPVATRKRSEHEYRCVH
jgi:peptide/nickel transport system ATP-binding protein